MSSSNNWLKIKGTQLSSFVLGFLGVRLKDDAGDLAVRTNDDTGYAAIKASEVNLEGAYEVNLKTSASQTADYSLTLPVDSGSPGQQLTTDGSGVLTWEDAGDTSLCWKADTTSFAFGSGATVTMFTLPANAVVDRVSVIIDTAFDDSPSMSVGVNGGSASKYIGSGDVLMTSVGRYDVPNDSVANGSSEDLEIYYTPASSTVGAGRVLVTYAIPA